MATYPVIHKETGEQKEVSMSIHDWNKWLEDNPDWQEIGLIHLLLHGNRCW